MNVSELSRQIIMDHYKYPHNKVEQDIEDSNYLIKQALNPSCGDEIKVFILIEDDIVKDVKFKGSGCSICCSSASILTEELKGKSIEEVKTKIKNYENMLIGSEFDDEQFEDAICFENLKDYPARFKCAFISWGAVKDLVDESEQ